MRPLFLLTALGCGLLLPSLPAWAFWGPPEPTVTAAYDDVACTGIGKILVTVVNPSGEPLANISVHVDVYQSGHSTRITTLKLGSDRIIAAGTSMAWCVDLSSMQLPVVLAAMHDLNPVEVMLKFGDVSNGSYTNRDFLKGAVFSAKVVDFTYGLPY